eukprot:52400-Amphidinium_carterae.1
MARKCWRTPRCLLEQAAKNMRAFSRTWHQPFMTVCQHCVRAAGAAPTVPPGRRHHFCAGRTTGARGCQIGALTKLAGTTSRNGPKTVKVMKLALRALLP